MSCALRFSAVCDDARTSPDGKLDLHGVYHDLSAPGFPAKQDHLVLVLVIEWGHKDHGRFQFKADLEDSEGNISRRSVEIHDKWVLPISWRLDYLFGKFFGKNLMVRARRLY